MSFDKSRVRDRPRGSRFRSSRVWGDFFLLVIPICLLVLLLSRPTDQSRDNKAAPQVAPSTDLTATTAVQQQIFYRQQPTADASRHELAEVRMELQNALVAVAIAQADAEKQRRLAAEATARNATVEKGAQALRKDLDQVKTGGTGQARLRSELAQARQDLADIRRISANVGTLTAEVALAQRVRDGILTAYRATAASLSTTLQGLEEGRKAALAERELVAAREFIAQLEANADWTSLQQAGLLRSRQLAESDARQAGEAVDRERQRSSALADALETARRQRDAFQQELEHVLATSRSAVDREHEKTISLSRDLSAARESLARLETLAAMKQASLLRSKELLEATARQAGEALDRERENASVLAGHLETARRERDAARQELTRVSAASESALNEEREKAVALTRDLTSARKDIDAFRKDIDAFKAGGMREEDLRRELAVARQDLADMQRIGQNAGTRQAAVAWPMSQQETALEEQQAKAEELARVLALAQRELERVTDEAAATRSATASSLAGTTQALEQERQKVGLLEHDLNEARQSIATLEASAKLAATKQADLLEGRQFSDAAARQAGEALDRERESASALADDLETARRERDVARQELARVSAASGDALEQEREKSIALTRDLASARILADDLETARRERDVARQELARASAASEDALEQEHKKAIALTRDLASARILADDLETARRERDAARQELARVSAASEDALEQEREKSIALTRDLAAARKDLDAFQRRPDRKGRYVTKASVVDDVNGRPPVQRKSASNPDSPRRSRCPPH